MLLRLFAFLCNPLQQSIAEKMRPRGVGELGEVVCKDHSLCSVEMGGSPAANSMRLPTVRSVFVGDELPRGQMTFMPWRMPLDALVDTTLPSAWAPS